MMVDKNLNYYITKYFSDYLPNVIGTSKNTINSYRDAFVLLLEYINKSKKINLNKMPLDAINYTDIEKFLDYLETEKNNSINTRNQRLAQFHHFINIYKNVS